MAVMSKQERVLQVVLVVLGLGTVGASAHRSLMRTPYGPVSHTRRSWR